MMRRLVAVCLLALTLSSCDPETPPGVEPFISVIHVNVDGRTIPCIISRSAGETAKSMSCDWTAK